MSDIRTIKKPTVIVAGRNYCNILTMARALGQAGYNIEVLHLYKKKPSFFNPFQGMKPEAYSKYVKKTYECIVGPDAKSVVNLLIEIASNNAKPLLIPVDDYTACIVDDYLDDLENSYILPSINSTSGEIHRLMDKNEQKRLAVDFGLPLLNSVLIESHNGNFDIPTNIDYPCFIKPNVSMNSTKAKMKKCNSVEDLKIILSNYAKDGDFELLVEKYANIKAEYSLLGVSTPDGTIAPALFKALAGGHRERKGVAITGEIVETKHFKNIINQCVDYINALGYVGIFDIDFIETQDGNVYFIEVNFRAGASTYAFVKAGVNLAGMFADNLIKGIPLDKKCEIKCSGTTFVSEKVLLEEYVRSDISFDDYNEYIRQADICFMKDDIDSKPYDDFKKYILLAHVMRIPYRLRDMLRNK